MEKYILTRKRLREICADYRHYFSDKKFVLAVILGAFFFLTSLAIDNFAALYADHHASNYVTDILLDNIPVFNVNFIVNEVLCLFIYIIAFFILAKPQRLPFVLKSLALFVLIRSIFITLTHLGVPPSHSYLNPNDWLSSIAGGQDLFFSGHTGMPFLLALIFWNDKPIRWTALVGTVIFGSAVILGHLHYSIDVFSAFFITYTIFEIAKKIFPQDYQFLISTP
ncbi:MAG: phosphatase PAP2-related protein [Candidatus Pacebacteria bacterium]|nr:phosphatase PAP2-related protein [Candidatus Paceibacterota bacterium]MDR3583004.1 phosphatase PAP2-related protein [Candidatus Paceibacterota bacterium]